MKLIDKNSYMVPLEVRDDLMVLNGDLALPISTEVINILIDFFNLGVERCLHGGSTVYTDESEIEHEVLTTLEAFGLASCNYDRNDTNVSYFLPTMLYGVVGIEIIERFRKALGDQIIDWEK